MSTEWNKLIVATYNAYLHKHSICPGNHDVSYYRGHLYFDNEVQTKDFTDKIRIAAQQNKDDGYIVAYNPTYNTFVLMED